MKTVQESRGKEETNDDGVLERFSGLLTGVRGVNHTKGIGEAENVSDRDGKWTQYNSLGVNTGKKNNGKGGTTSADNEDNKSRVALMKEVKDRKMSKNQAKDEKRAGGIIRRR